MDRHLVQAIHSSLVFSCMLVRVHELVVETRLASILDLPNTEYVVKYIVPYITTIHIIFKITQDILEIVPQLFCVTQILSKRNKNRKYYRSKMKSLCQL